MLAWLALPAPVMAHHNKGLPHYGYYENYPQVPIEEYVAIDGPWEIGAVIFNFQGLDRRNADTPNDVKIYLYLYDARSGESYGGPLRVEIRSGDEVVASFSRLQVDEEAVYSTRETLPRSGNYEIVAFAKGEEVRLPFYVELASDSIPWARIALVGVPVLALSALVFHGRRRRKSRGRRIPAAGSAHG